MNYLGHAYFSTAATFIGNMAGDSLKGIDLSVLSTDLAAGISRHIRIDAVTDSHPAFVSIRSLFSAADLPYAGVLADLAIDWVLASDWHCYSAVGWEDFKKEVYSRLERDSGRMPGYFTVSAGWLVRENWFDSYRSIEGMATAFFRLSRKTRRDIDIKAACAVLRGHQDELCTQARAVITALFSEPLIAADFPELLSRPCILLQGS